MLFEKPEEWDTTGRAAATALEQYASRLGLDVPSFRGCMSDGRYRANVNANQAEGMHLGITGTPAFVINGKLLSGAHPYSVFKRAFDREIESTK